jgi:hypothetical protein
VYKSVELSILYLPSLLLMVKILSQPPKVPKQYQQI